MASVFLGDLDDFLVPSQSCTNPLFAGSASGEAKVGEEEGDGGRAKVTLDAWEDIGKVEIVKPDLIKTTQGKKATVSLNDCLACR